jgi:hypothetical protein
MFVRDFIQVSRPFEDVAPRLVRDADWLNPVVHDALEDAMRAHETWPPGAPIGAELASPAVRCTRGPVRIRTDTLVVLLRWEADPPIGPIPSLEGDLEVAPMGESRSQLSLSAQCAPFGRSDPASQRVVETGLRAFLERLALVFEDSA